MIFKKELHKVIEFEFILLCESVLQTNHRLEMPTKFHKNILAFTSESTFTLLIFSTKAIMIQEIFGHGLKVE